MTPACPPGGGAASDTVGDLASLISDFGACFYVWHTNRWRASGKDVFYWGQVAGTVGELRAQLDAALARAVPELRAQLRAAEAAAARLHQQQNGRREAGVGR